MRGNAAGWGSPEVVVALAGGALLVAAFVAWERRAPEPMLPMRFFRSRAFSAGNVAIFFTFASLFGAVFFLAQFLQTTLGYGPLEAGLRLLPWTGDAVPRARRWRARWPTATASGRSWSAGCCCRRSAWAGSP